MKKNERDIFDDLIRSKLQHFEPDTIPDDWQLIESRLPKKVIPFRRRLTYIAAAAVVSLLLITGSLYISQNNKIDTTIAGQIEKETKTIESQIKEELKETPVLPVTSADKQPVTIAVAKVQEIRSTGTRLVRTVESHAPITETLPDNISENNFVKEEIPIPQTYPLIIDNSSVKDIPVKHEKEKTKSSRKWGFGMGAGGFTEATGNTVNTYVLKSNSLVEDERLTSMNANADLNRGKEPKTNIKHRTPVSFGFSVSRHLNDRFSLQTGLTYSMLNSDWETQGSAYNNKTRQRLHFVGIPVSLSYKIAEWNRFRFYASAGVQTQVNVAGQLRIRSFVEEQHIGTKTESTRMKEWQWSVNAHAGISYPIIRYINAFAEFGAAYFIDNGSNIETIYSDKPFNISPQIGLRLSF